MVAVSRRITGHGDGPGPADNLKDATNVMTPTLPRAPVPEHGLDSRVRGGCPGISGNDPAARASDKPPHQPQIAACLADTQVAVFTDDSAHGLRLPASPTMERESLMLMSGQGFPLPPCGGA